jgi:hypothetical protein
VSLMEALAVVRNEETHLRSAGLLQSTLVLAAQSVSSEVPASSPKVPSSVASGSGTHS